METSKNRKEVCSQLIELARQQYQQLQKIASNVREHVCDAQVAMQATYDTTREEQSWLHDGLNLRLNEISDLLDMLEMAASSDRSVIGMVYSIEMDGVIEDYVLVPNGFCIDLSPLKYNAVSLGSPMGKCLLVVKQPNSLVDYHSPDGKLNRIIIKNIIK